MIAVLGVGKLQVVAGISNPLLSCMIILKQNWKRWKHENFSIIFLKPNNPAN
jgi:hypothetical protein